MRSGWYRRQSWTPLTFGLVDPVQIHLLHGKLGTYAANPLQHDLRIAGSATECEIEAHNRLLSQRTFVAFGPLLESGMNFGRDIL